MTHTDTVQGTLRDALFLHLKPVWLRGAERAADTPLRSLELPRGGSFRPLTLWALFDHPVTFVRLRLGAARGDRHAWLGFQTTVTRESDARRCQQELRAVLQDAVPTAMSTAMSTAKSTDKAPDAPRPLPPHRYVLQLPPDRRDTPQGNLHEVMSPVLCNFMEALSARGNRAVLDFQVRTTTAMPELAEALDMSEGVSDRLRRTMDRPEIIREDMDDDVDRQERANELIDQMGAFEIAIRLCTEQPIEPSELKWVLQQLEETVQPRGCWSTDTARAHSATLNAWGLNALVAMQWAKEPSELPF